MEEPEGQAIGKTGTLTLAILVGCGVVSYLFALVLPGIVGGMGEFMGFTAKQAGQGAAARQLEGEDRRVALSDDQH